MPKYTNGKRVINATEKAYEVLYKARGFKPYEKQENTQTNDVDLLDDVQNEQLPVNEGDTQNVDDEQGEAVQSELMGIKKDELLEMAQGMQLEVNDKMTKAEIVAAIEAADAE